MAKRLSVQRPSGRLMRACCRFGIGIARARERRPAPDLGALARLLELPEGGQARLVGPSGCGKSSLLRALQRELRRKGVPCALIDCTRHLYIDRAVVDVIPLGLEPTLRLLAAVGLSDPLLLWRRPRELSTGERARLLLARGLARAKRGGWLLVDEYLSTLDEGTARAVDVAFCRASRERGVRLVLAGVGRVQMAKVPKS